MTIYWKMMLGFMVVIVLLTAVDGYILFELRNVSATTRSILTRDVQSVDLAKQLRTTLFDEERYAQKYLVSRDSTYFTLFLDQSRLFLHLIDSLGRQPADSAVHALVRDAERKHIWHFTVVEGIHNTGQGRAMLSPAQEQHRIDTLDVLYKDFDDMIRLKQRLVASSVVGVEEAANRSADVALLLTIGTLLTALTLAFIITRTITEPLKVLVRGTQQVAKGSFDRIHVSTRGEIQHLAAAFNIMSDSLRKATALRAEMMQHISHELRMPLQTMHAAYYLLTEQKAGPLNEGQMRLLKSMRDNIDKIARFSNQFLDLAKIEAGMMEYELVPTDIPAVLAPIVDDATVTAARKEIAIALSVQPVFPVRANPEKCGQIFTNLLSNAVKYTNKGGNVKVEVCPSDTGVKVSIADSGVGIAPQELSKVFRKFYRASNVPRASGSGTGIGLALVKALTEGMGGTISVSSVLGEGSTFVVEFPRMNNSSRGTA